MDPTQVKTKLIGYGFSLLEGVDPNPDNYVCAGIIHTKTIQIGCLMRLEPNHSANVSINFAFKLYFFAKIGYNWNHISMNLGWHIQKMIMSSFRWFKAKPFKGFPWLS